MTQTPTKTQFPDSSQSPWENPDNGLIYEWNGWGWDIVSPDEPDEPDPQGGSAFTFAFEVCKEADFAGAEGKISLELSSQKDDFSLPLQTANLFRYSEKDVNGSTTPLLSDGWSVHFYAEDVSNNERGGATLGWRSVTQNDREAVGKVENSINQSITRIDEGSIIQLIFTPSSEESAAVEISEGLPSRPWEEGDLYFDATEDELTLYIYLGDDWAPAAPPVSLDGIQSDIVSLEGVANDVRRQLAYQTVEAQKADLKILQLEEGVADLNEKVDAIDLPSEAGYIKKDGDEMTGKLEVKPTSGLFSLVVFATPDASGSTDIFRVRSHDDKQKFYADASCGVGVSASWEPQRSNHLVPKGWLEKYVSDEIGKRLFDERPKGPASLCWEYRKAAIDLGGPAEGCFYKCTKGYWRFSFKTKNGVNLAAVAPSDKNWNGSNRFELTFWERTAAGEWIFKNHTASQSTRWGYKAPEGGPTHFEFNDTWSSHTVTWNTGQIYYVTASGFF